MFFPFLYLSYIILLYTSLVTIFLITYIVLLFLFYIYDDVCCYSSISPYVVSFFSLYTCFFMYAIFYFYFTLRCLDEFCLKCFRKTSCQNLSYHELSSCKVFSRICVRIRCYCTQQVIMSLVIYDFSLTLFVCCGFIMNFQKGRLLGHIWNLLEHMLYKIG